MGRFAGWEKDSQGYPGEVGFLEQRQLFHTEGRPTPAEMMRYADAHRDQFAVELICRVRGNTKGGLVLDKSGLSGGRTPPDLRSCRARPTTW